MGEGRPTDCTPAKIDEIERMLLQGYSTRVAARMAFTSEKCVYEWMQRGEKGEEPYAGFRERVMRARGIAEHEFGSVLRKRALVDGDVPALKFILTTQFADGWTERTEISGPDGGPVQVQSLAAEIAAQLATVSDKEVGIPDDL